MKSFLIPKREDEKGIEAPGGGRRLRQANNRQVPSGVRKIFDQKKKRKLTKREAEEWNALLKETAPTYEPDGQEAAYDERCEEEECRQLSGKLARESANKTGDRIGEIRDRYETIVLELLAARYTGADGKRYSLATVLRGKYESDSALKEFLPKFAKWIGEYVSKMHPRTHLRVYASLPANSSNPYLDLVWSQCQQGATNRACRGIRERSRRIDEIS